MVGISHDTHYKHRRFPTPIVIDAMCLLDNHKKFVFDDLHRSGHTYDIVLSTNHHERISEYIQALKPPHGIVWVDTKSTSLHEREREIMKYCQLNGSYNGCFLFRCDLVFKSYVSFMPVRYDQMNFPFHQVMYERWKELRFKRVPTYNKDEVGGGLYFIPRRLFERAEEAFCSIIPDDRIHHLNEYFDLCDVHFISNRRYQSNTDVMENPLFDFQRSSQDEQLNPNMKENEYEANMRLGYRSVRNKHPDFIRCIQMLNSPTLLTIK